MSRFHAGVDATKVKFVDILENDVKLRNVVSCYVANAVQSILNGNDTEAHYEALFANILEQFIATYLEKAQPRVRWQRLWEMEQQDLDLHSVVSFLKKRIPCKCLDEKYKDGSMLQQRVLSTW